MVKVGQRVKTNAPLFRIDDRDRKAELEVRKTMLEDAKAAPARPLHPRALSYGLLIPPCGRDRRCGKVERLFSRVDRPLPSLQRQSQAAARLRRCFQFTARPSPRL